MLVVSGRVFFSAPDLRLPHFRTRNIFLRCIGWFTWEFERNLGIRIDFFLSSGILFGGVADIDSGK